MAESVNRKLERVRAPRVHLKYEVHTGDAIERKELPFVMGVLGNFSGAPTEPLKRLRDRKFVEITPHTFDAVLEKMNPRLSLKVKNRLTDDPNAGNLPVNLSFKNLDDFSPERVAQQVEPLSKLLELRQQLVDLRGTLQGNDKLEEILRTTLTEERVNRLRAEHASEDTSDVNG
jgi:type VI secretion system protein ImpB